MHPQIVPGRATIIVSKGLDGMAVVVGRATVAHVVADDDYTISFHMILHHHRERQIHVRATATGSVPYARFQNASATGQRVFLNLCIEGVEDAVLANAICNKAQHHTDFDTANVGLGADG